LMALQLDGVLFSIPDSCEDQFPYRMSGLGLGQGEGCIMDHIYVWPVCYMQCFSHLGVHFWQILYLDVGRLQVHL
jgi:hypothetical protein